MFETKGKIKLFTEICDDDVSRQKGLMYRKHLGQNQGMLFVFSCEDYYSFWMKNTYIPLDIAFIDSSGKIVDIKSMYPLSVKAVKSNKPCKYALEVNRGWFDDNKISVGNFLWGGVKTSSADSLEVSFYHDFKSSVEIAFKNGWNLIITYRFRPVEYRKGKAVQRDADKPFLNDYQIILDKSTTLSDGKQFEYEDSGNGEYIIVPCSNASGEARCFFVDGVVDFRFFYNGKVFSDPAEIAPMNKRKKKRLRPDMNPALEGIQSIPF